MRLESEKMEEVLILCSDSLQNECTVVSCCSRLLASLVTPTIVVSGLNVCRRRNGLVTFAVGVSSHLHSL